MRNRIFILSLLLWACFSPVFAQVSITAEGVIVLVNNDTLRGTIKERNPDQKISIRTQGKTEFREYGIDEVKSVWFQNDYYYKPVRMSSDPTGEQRFLLCLAEGAIDLFKYKEIFLVKKGNDKPVKLEKNDVRVRDTMKIDTHYRRLLYYLMSDCPAVFKKVSKTEFIDVHLVKLVELYNLCIDPDSRPVSRANPVRIKLKKGIRAGVAFHRMRYENQQSGSEPDRIVTFEPLVAFAGGIFVNFTYADKFSLQPELLFTKKSGSYRGNLGGIYERAYSIEQTLLQLPVSLYYTFRASKIRPFLSAGGLIGYALQNESQKEFVGAVTIIEANKVEYGYRAGAGIRFDVNAKSALFLEYLFESTGVRTDVLHENFNGKSHHVSVRFGF